MNNVHLFVLTLAGKPILALQSNHTGAQCMLDSGGCDIPRMCGVLAVIGSNFANSDASVTIARPNQRLYIANKRQALFVCAIACHGRNECISDFLLQGLCDWSLAHLEALLTRKLLYTVLRGKPNFDLTSLLTGSEKIFDSCLKRYCTFWGNRLLNFSGAAQVLGDFQEITSKIAGDLRDLASKIPGHKDMCFFVIFQPPHTILHFASFTPSGALSTSELRLLLNWFVADSDTGLRSNYTIGTCWVPVCLPSIDADRYCHIFVGQLSLPSTYIIIAHRLPTGYSACQAFAQSIDQKHSVFTAFETLNLSRVFAGLNAFDGSRVCIYSNARVASFSKGALATSSFAALDEMDFLFSAFLQQLRRQSCVEHALLEGIKLKLIARCSGRFLHLIKADSRDLIRLTGTGNRQYVFKDFSSLLV